MFICCCKHGGDLYFLVDLYGKAVENRNINTTGIHMHKYTVCTHTQQRKHTRTHTQTHTLEDLALSAPSKLGCRESISPLLHPLLPLLLALCADPERMSSPSALMPRCRVKHREKLYYSETGERRRRGTEEAWVERRSVREKHKWGGR